MRRQLLTITLAMVLLVLTIAGLSFLLTGKNQGLLMDHSSHQELDVNKFNSLVGKPAPDFELTSYDGQKISLSNYRGKKVVLFFTEGVMCYPSCWNQIAAFAKDEDFKKEDVVVLNIVVDSRNEWERAVSKMPDLGSAVILHDTSREVSAAYGVLFLPSSMHKGQYPGHTYVLVDPNGIVRYVFDDYQMAVRNAELKAELQKWD